MKKFSNMILLLMVMVSCSGCNQYFISTTPENQYYGAYNRRDFIHADVKVFEKDSNLVCDGSIYLNAPSRSITFKNDAVPAKMKLGCNDGKILDINWQLKKGSYADGIGEGIDQFNNVYIFKTVSKSNFKDIAGENLKIVFPNDCNKSYLKY